MKSKDPKQLRYLKFSSLGLEMGLAVAVGFYLGSWMDEKFDTEPWLLIFWVFAGLGAAFKALLRAAKNLQEDSKDDDKRPD